MDFLVDFFWGIARALAYCVVLFWGLAFSVTLAALGLTFLIVLRERK